MGTTFSIGPLASATGSPTYTAVAEVISVDFTGAKADIVDTTNMSSGGYHEKLATLADAGQVKVMMNRISNDPGQMALAAAFASPNKYLFEVQLPVDAAIGQTTTGDLYKFAAIVSGGPEFTLDATKVPQVTYTLEISGGITLTEGA